MQSFESSANDANEHGFPCTRAETIIAAFYSQFNSTCRDSKHHHKRRSTSSFARTKIILDGIVDNMDRYVRACTRTCAALVSDERVFFFAPLKRIASKWDEGN